MPQSLSRNMREKVHLLFLAFSPLKFSGLAHAIFPDWDEERAKTMQRSLDHYWTNSGNTSAITIPKQLIEHWGFKAKGPSALLYCSVAEFARAMPADRLEQVLADPRHSDVLTPEDVELLRKPSQREQPRLHRHGMGRGYHVVHVTPAYDASDLSDALERGEFDQKYLYLDRTAAARWEALTINPDRYGTFRSCQDTLEDLVANEPWTALVPEIETVVVLGGGAAKKDDKIIRSLIANRAAATHPVQYVVIDTSVHMLLSTLRELEKLVDHQRHANFLEVVGFVADFTCLEDTLRILQREGAGIHRHGKRAVFFLPGNTLANLNPEDTFEHIWDNSAAHDLFLVSVETVREGEEEKFSTELEYRYRQRDLVNLVLPPLRPFLDAKGIDVIGDRALKKIKSQPIQGYWPNLHMRDAFTIEIRLQDPAAEIDVVLATSSRYHLQALIQGAKTLGFDLIQSAQIRHTNHDHHQLLLERRGTRRLHG